MAMPAEILPAADAPGKPMVLSGVVFLFRFLPIFFLLYFLVPKKAKNAVLLVGSLLFYAWGEPVYIVLMLFSTVSDYLHGMLIEKNRGKRKAFYFLLSSLTINLAMLGFFKYSGVNLPLPIGISFYTFQTMSYVIDVYRGDVPAQKNFLQFAVFVTMFPQLVAGPIVTYGDVAEQLKERHASPENMAAGIVRFLVGLAKKVLLANNIGVLFTEVTSLSSEKMTTMSAWLCILAYAFQIYFDFSGYSDMAIGLGKILGFTFPENFHYPYIARSITDFWRRWHMSLSGWFRDYVYIPLGGNRKGMKRQLLNIFIVWTLTGIWHGAGINFLLWGMWFALFLILEKLFLGKILQKIPGFFGWLYTMFLVLLSWSFFSIEDGTVLANVWRSLFFRAPGGVFNREALYFWENYRLLFFLLAISSLPIGKNAAEKIWRRLFCTECVQSVRAKILSCAGAASYTALEILYLGGLFLLSIANIVDASYNPFLYFRF